MLYAWGDDDAGQLGIGSISDAANAFDQDAFVPEWSHMPAGAQTVAAAAGQSHTLAVTSEGAVYATGYNSDGQLGDGTRNATVSPVAASHPARRPHRRSVGGLQAEHGPHDDRRRLRPGGPTTRARRGSASNPLAS